MKEKLITIEFKCIFCGMVGGDFTIGVPEDDTKTHTLQEFGFVDHRCADCTALHGNFKDMTLEYAQKTGLSSQEAETFVKENPKKEDFDKELEAMLKSVVK